MTKRHTFKLLHDAFIITINITKNKEAQSPEPKPTKRQHHRNNSTNFQHHPSVFVDDQQPTPTNPKFSFDCIVYLNHESSY